LSLAVACGKSAATVDAAATDAGTDASAKLAPLATAEDARRAEDVTEALRTDPDPVVRRRAARALARIGGDSAEAPLLKLLVDEDEQVVAWAAYGLGFTCKGHEEAHVRALVARAESLGTRDAGAPSTLDARASIIRAIGKCGGPLAEPTLAAWVKAKDARSEPAAIALGDVAARRETLDDETVTNLLDAAEGGERSALFPFARLDRFNDAFADRLRAAAIKGTNLGQGDGRAFAIRALGKSGADAVPELARIAGDTAQYDAAERAEAARALGKLGAEGQAAAATTLGKLLPNADPFALLALTGSGYSVLVALLAASGAEATKTSQPVLEAVTRLRAPGDAPGPLGRRLAALRCDAAAILAKGAYDVEGLRSCDDKGTFAWERARLHALLKRPLVADRRAAWVAATKSTHLRVREEALEAISAHPELGSAAIGPLADALGDAHPGVVATAADVLHAHPERVLVLAAKERQAALDPRAPPPSLHPAQELDPAIAKALAAALAKTWSPDLFETRLALLDAAASLRVPSASATAKAMCADPNVTVRERAVKALKALGEASPACPAPATPELAKELATPLAGDPKLTFKFETGELVITLDATLAPIAAARFVALAKAGFYDKLTAHRVVPGFVVQFGDPQADGYGGSGTPLRDETSPVPFQKLDVGIAIAGRDTGSSQLFVTLGRFPHLDGDYARIGHATGDAAAIAEGDAITSVVVAE
jgi:cyclophilin family peptidyl-prolyl cis-trans isomerase/HEAT repeat protein